MSIIGTVLITGSNSGFGVAIALAFLRRDHRVIATMRDPRRADVLLAEAGRADLRPPDVMPLDVTNESSRSSSVDEAIRRYGCVDVLVNNAGIAHLGAVEDTSGDVYRQVFETNVFGPTELTRCLLPHMRARGSGRIVNVSAIGAVLCTPYLSAYVASKHALDAMTAALDLEIRPFGLRAVSVLPAAFRTAIASNAGISQDSDPYLRRVREFRTGFNERISTASLPLSDVADVVVEAATDDRPSPRYLVGGPVIETIRPVVDAMNDLHQLEAERLGL